MKYYSGVKKQDILLQFAVVCSFGNVYIRTEDMEDIKDKRNHFKTIYIIEKGNRSSVEQKKTRSNQHLLEIKLILEALYHSVKRQAKK